MGIQTKGSKKGTCQYCIQRRERGFQKKIEQILVDIQQQQQQHHQHHRKEERFTIVSTDKSFFFYDCLVRRVWIDAKKREDRLSE